MATESEVSRRDRRPGLSAEVLVHHIDRRGGLSLPQLCLDLAGDPAPLGWAANSNLNMLSPFRAFALLTILLSPPTLLVADIPAPAPPESAAPETAAPRKADPAVEKYWQACKLLRSTKPADLAAGRAALQASADLEFTHAQTLLGNCLISGSYGFAKDAHKGANLFRLAAERGNAFAKASLGQYYFTGTGVRKDMAKAAEWLTAALAPGADYSRPIPPPDFFATDSTRTGRDNGGVAGELEHDPMADSQATAHFLLGQISDQQKKTAEAQAHYIAAAIAGPGGRDGIYLAALQAALNFAFGNGTPRDLTKANEMLDQSRKLAGRMGVSLIHNYVALKVVDEFATADLEESLTKAGEAYETELQYKIASTFANKKSKDYNITEAVKWYELAAESGQAWAMLSLAFIYNRGDLGQPDPLKAFHWFEKAGAGDNPKHFLGAANLAICYQNGIGTEKNLENAATLFSKHRDNDIVCYLGTIGQCPDHVLTYEQELSLNQKWAKEKKDPHAQYLIGDRFLSGAGVAKDFNDAVKWFKKAAIAGDGASLCELGYLYSKHGFDLGCATLDEAEKKTAEYYAKAMEAGSIEAIFSLAWVTYLGEGVAKDEAKASALYERCLLLKPNHRGAHNNLANIQKERLIEAKKKGQTVDPVAVAAMLQHYDAANKAGDKYSVYNLGWLYREGGICPKDPQKAYGYFETAAERGHVDARLIVGEMLEHGEGAPVSLSEAAYHYRLAALDGNQEALRRLINFYLTGQGVDLDLDRAAFWLNQLVRQGKIGALIPLADVLVKRGESETAIKLLKQLSEVNQPAVAGYACERLSRYYLNGIGVKADPDKAHKYFDRATALGNGDALTRLGMRQLAEKNASAALDNFQKAAKSSPKACFYLGQMYYFGTNVEKNETKALRFMRDAAEGNQLDALLFLATLTFNRANGAPALDEAIRFAQQAETGGLDKARVLREKLEQRRKDANAAPEEATRARAS